MCVCVCVDQLQDPPETYKMDELRQQHNLATFSFTTAEHWSSSELPVEQSCDSNPAHSRTHIMLQLL